MSSHLSHEEINAKVQYDLGHTDYFILSANKLTEIEYHLENCAECRESYKLSKDDFNFILKQPRQVFFHKYYYIAASIAAMLILYLNFPMLNTNSVPKSENLVKNEEFEELLANPLRAAGLQVLSPVNNTRSKSVLKFEIKYEGQFSELSLRIFDHTEKTVFTTKELSKDFILSPKIADGYYYFVIESPDEALFYGSFYWEK